MKNKFSLTISLLFGLLACNQKETCTSHECSPKREISMALVDTFISADYFKNQFAEADMKYQFKATTKEELVRWQTAFRKDLKETIGLSKLEKRYENYVPTAQKVDSEDIGFAIRERWTIWTEPSVPLPIVIVIPKKIEKNVPLVIAPHGHNKNPENYAGIYLNEADSIEGIKAERNIAIQAAQNGMIGIAPTTRGFGKTRTAQDIKNDATHSCRIQLMHDLLVGRTPIGDRVWDIIKIIDWALDNLPIENSKVIVSGNSGGGAVTLFSGACDTRIAATLSGSYFCTFTGSIAAMRHCDCNYIPGILDLGEMSDIAGLITPRYFSAIHGNKDHIYPIGETKHAYAELQKIYKTAGVKDNCNLYIGDEGHRFYKKGMWDFLSDKKLTE